MVIFHLTADRAEAVGETPAWFLHLTVLSGAKCTGGVTALSVGLS